MLFKARGMDKIVAGGVSKRKDERRIPDIYLAQVEKEEHTELKRQEEARRVYSFGSQGTNVCHYFLRV
jgi:hypothetical protein